MHSSLLIADGLPFLCKRMRDYCSRFLPPSKKGNMNVLSLTFYLPRVLGPVIMEQVVPIPTSIA